MTDQGDGLGPLPAARLSGLPALATLHLVIPNRRRTREAVSKRMLALPRRVICVSDAVARYARSATDRITVVRPGISEPRLAANPRAELGLEPDTFVVGGIGRLHDQKGWDVLCAAAARIIEGVPSARVVVVGDGPERERLAATPPCSAVRFVGHRGDASSLLGAFDVLVVPSRYEAFGLVAVEAMYAGVPVIAADVGGLPEAVGDGGVLVPVERADLLAEAVIELARDQGRRADLAKRGVARARAVFTAQRMADETLAVYEGLLT
jgi:glycosyltransferase involved in cell wall biosynthesis